MNKNPLVPKHKSDTETARLAVLSGYPEVEPVLAELLNSLKDFNWPIAKILAPFLANLGATLIPHIDSVLVSNDYIWKYWVISCIIAESPVLFAHYEKQLSRIAQHPTKLEQHHELDDVARAAINKQS